MDEFIKGSENRVKVQRVLLNWKELSNVRKFNIRCQYLSHHVDKICGQNVKVNLLSISSIPSGEEKIQGDVIDEKLLIKYLHGKENNSSANRRAVDQQLKFLHGNDKSWQVSSNECKVLTVDENYEVFKDTIMDEKANADKRTKVRFSMCCRNAIVCNKYDCIK